ncbi:MAG: hypothetical protein JXR46_06730 [Calditrichaceae bacterium]|nr:hypothetical protein [Calditrichaceae bacterium]MBN2708724.1 hypothetical protein [Calditrichaceae bacterium]RQV92153.1 MAG: hypothetical protein EH224_16370 [Calditrichota bacterium]
MFIVKYAGPFGYIKPWTAVRDIETFSQQFLTPSILEGIEKKIFPELLEEKGIKKILRHRLTYAGISKQQEQTQPRGLKLKTERIDKKKKIVEIIRTKSILTRGILIKPILYLAFEKKEDSEIAIKQHICLCRNEDILYPMPFDFNKYDFIREIDYKEFDNPDGEYCGFELMIEKINKSFIVGYNRFNDNKPMYGWINIIGRNPLHKKNI